MLSEAEASLLQWYLKRQDYHFSRDASASLRPWLDAPHAQHDAFFFFLAQPPNPPLLRYADSATPVPAQAPGGGGRNPAAPAAAHARPPSSPRPALVAAAGSERAAAGGGRVFGWFRARKFSVARRLSGWGRNRRVAAVAAGIRATVAGAYRGTQPAVYADG